MREPEARFAFWPGPMEGVMTPEVVRAAGALELVPRWLTPFFRLSETLPGERVFRRFYEPFAAAGTPVFVQLMGEYNRVGC